MYRLYKHDWMHGGKARTLPCEIVVLLSRQCFLNCATCGTKAMYGSDERFTDFLDVRDMRRMADELASWRSPVYVKMTGGEATMHPQFFEILDYFAYKKVPVRLSTNGVLFKAQEKAYALVDSGLEVVTISVDGASEGHNQIRKVKNLYQNIMAGIAHIQERRRQKKAKKPMIQIATIISRYNYETIDRFVRDLEKIGVDWLHMGFCQYMRDEHGVQSEKVCKALGGVGDDKWKFWRDNPLTSMEGIDCQVLSEKLGKIFSEQHSFPVTMFNIGGYSAEHIRRWHFTDELIHQGLCANPYVSMVVLSPGLACFCIDFPQFYYGDLRKNSLKEIWFSEQAQTFRRRFLGYYKEHNQNMPQCIRCGWRFW